MKKTLAIMFCLLAVVFSDAHAGYRAKPDIFLMPEVSSHHFNPGEHLFISYRLYSAVPISNLTIELKDKRPESYEIKQMNFGDWRILRYRNRNGKRYRTWHTGKIEITLPDSGEYIIAPLAASCDVMATDVLLQNGILNFKSFLSLAGKSQKVQIPVLPLWIEVNHFAAPKHLLQSHENKVDFYAEYLKRKKAEEEERFWTSLTLIIFFSLGTAGGITLSKFIKKYNPALKFRSLLLRFLEDGLSWSSNLIPNRKPEELVQLIDQLYVSPVNELEIEGYIDASKNYYLEKLRRFLSYPLVRYVYTVEGSNGNWELLRYPWLNPALHAQEMVEKFKRKECKYIVYEKEKRFYVIWLLNEPAFFAFCKDRFFLERCYANPALIAEMQNETKSGTLIVDKTGKVVFLDK